MIRRGWPLLLSLLLLTGCASPATPPAPPAPVAAPQPAGTDDTAQAPPGHGFAVEAAPAGALEHLQVAPGKPIGRAGIFFLQLADSSVEGWSIPGQDVVQYDVSEDGRWVSAWTQQHRLLADRRSGAVYRWPAAAGRLLAARGERLLFAGAGQLWLALGDPRQLHPVALEVQAQQPVQALSSPEGSTLAVLSGKTLYLLQADSGALRQSISLPADQPGGSVDSIRLTPSPSGKGLVLVGAYSQQPGRPAHVWTYSWQGQLQSDRQAPAWGDLSPDGSLMAWQDGHAGFEGSVVLSTASDFQPRLRVLSASPCDRLGGGATRWLADSSALVIYTHDGYRLLRTDGTLVDLPAFRGLGDFSRPVPAPDRTDRFMVGGMRVVDSDGRQLAAAVPNRPGQSLVVAPQPWGESSQEARYVLYSGGGKDTGCGGPMLAPRVERAPLPATMALQVSVGSGDCVNLRADLDRKAPVLTCLPGGTRLLPADPPGQLNKGYLSFHGNPYLTDMGGASWLHVRTPDGRRGWVLLDATYLTWADPLPSEAADPLAGHIADAAANLRHWLRVATGDDACTVSCAPDNSFSSALDGALDWCQQPVPNLKHDPAYSQERYGAALAPIEGACAALQSAGKWGDLKDTPAWHQAVQDALGKLSI